MVMTYQDNDKKGGSGIMVGGYLINDLTHDGHNPSEIVNDGQQGGNISGALSIMSSFKDLAVPLGLVYLQQTASKTPVSDVLDYIKKSPPAVISESLYDNLLNLVSVKKKTKSKTKRNKYKLKKHSKTKKR